MGRPIITVSDLEIRWGGGPLKAPYTFYYPGDFDLVIMFFSKCMRSLTANIFLFNNISPSTSLLMDTLASAFAM